MSSLRKHIAKRRPLTLKEHAELRYPIAPNASKDERMFVGFCRSRFEQCGYQRPYEELLREYQDVMTEWARLLVMIEDRKRERGARE